MPGCDGKVKIVYVKMTSKHSSMNSAATREVYMKMQNQLLEEDDCICCLVEINNKKSKNMKWTISVDGNKMVHKRIRRLSIDEFYTFVTGHEDAFYEICMALPTMIKKLFDTNEENIDFVENVAIENSKDLLGFMK